MKIGIVEDELIIADSIVKLLQEMNYAVTEPAISYAEAVEMLEDEKPDLVLVDIQLRGKKDGIELARYINEHCGIPFIFLTANADAVTVARAKEVSPLAYLVKPFSKEDLYTSIEICLDNFNRKNAPARQKPTAPVDSFFIKEGSTFHKVLLNEILYVESDHVYVNIVTTTKKFLVRASLQDYASKLDPIRFIRVHRSYLVNLNRIEKIENEHLTLDGHQIPLSKSYREGLFQYLNIK
jgi:DNA-binding LytR/AlgR family response regulator